MRAKHPHRSTGVRRPGGRARGALLGTLPVLLLACGTDAGSGDIDVTVLEIADAGFENPSAIIADTVADVYLVSNRHGDLGERDGQGFISRLSPDGEVLDLFWIHLPGAEMALHSPKGMAIRGDSLFVADLDCVRIYHRETGAPQARICLDGDPYLSDVDVGPEGSVFVTSSGLRRGATDLEPTGDDAVYRMVLTAGSRSSTLAMDPELGNPSGIAVGRRGIFVTTSGTGEIFRLTPTGEKTTVIPRSGRHLDGIVFLPDGGFAFSSWSDSAVHMVSAEGRLIRVRDAIPEPGGIGYDPARHRLLVPVVGENRILFMDLPS